MGIHVLIIATRYNTAADLTYRWAENLRADLLSKTKGAVETCVLLDGEAFCHAGRSLADAIDCVDVVVFYGHGEDDHWISIPSKQGKKHNISLVNKTTVGVLKGRKVYGWRTAFYQCRTRQETTEDEIHRGRRRRVD